MVPLMRRFQRAVFQSSSSDLPTSDHSLLSPRPPLLSFGREKSFGKAVFLLVSCCLLFRDAACFVVSPCSLLFSPRNCSYITAYSLSLAAFSLSFIVASPSFVAVPHLSLSPICSKETEVGLLPTMDLYSVTRSFTSHSSTNLPAVYFAGYASVLCFFHPIMVLFLQDPWLQVCRLCALQFADWIGIDMFSSDYG
ncbi:unnamed protein product [Brassica rapa subsp. trilocularis]